MAGDIPAYETQVYPVYDEIDVVTPSNDEQKTEGGKCDITCAGRKVNKGVMLAVVLSSLVTALTVTLAITLSRKSGTPQPRFGEDTTSPETETITCPANMVYGNCIRCTATCVDPSGTEDCSNDCTDTQQTCICPADYLMDGPDCVPMEQCGCYRHGHVGGVIADGTTKVAPDCSEECTCTSGTLICSNIACAHGAMCKVVDGVRDCFCYDGYEGDGRTCVGTTFQDCYDISQGRSGGATSGDYTISPPGWTGGAFTINCNMTIDGGGWTVIQRHYQNSFRLEFNRNWLAYRNGFGNPSQEVWIGNEKLHYLTNQRGYELRIDMVNAAHDSYYAKYDFFRIGEERDKYRLSGLGIFTGTAGTDSLRAVGGEPHRSIYGMYFSTPDRDNDGGGEYDCASIYHGGWWFNQCAAAYANPGNARPSGGVGWWDGLRTGGSLIYTEMKIRPIRATG